MIAILPPHFRDIKPLNVLIEVQPGFQECGSRGGAGAGPGPRSGAAAASGSRGPSLVALSPQPSLRGSLLGSHGSGGGGGGGMSSSGRGAGGSGYAALSGGAGAAGCGGGDEEAGWGESASHR